MELRVCIILALFSVILNSANSAARVENKSQATIYLAKFGYLSPPQENGTSATHEVSSIPESQLKKAIKEFQSFAGIRQTGILDAETLKYMNEKRCGLSDLRSQPGYRWHHKDLTYRISRYHEQIRKTEVDAEVARAFHVWSEVTDLTFTPKSSGHVDIEIGFYSRDHNNEGPANSFDGAGGVLAHAFYPQTGSTHFDSAEPWTFNVPEGVNFFHVALHEFGHALGLSHTVGVRDSIMAPFFKGYVKNVTLHEVDIRNIQNLYGAKSGGSAVRPTTSTPYTTLPPPSTHYTPPSTRYTPPSTRYTPPSTHYTPPSTHYTPPSTRYTPPSTPYTPPPTRYPNYDTTPRTYSELCPDGKFDTIFTNKNYITYVFKNEKYWELTSHGIAPGYPGRIRDTWRGLPGNIDAAFTYLNGKTYFFKGSEYWRFNGTRMDPGYPKAISDPAGFPGIPNNIDTAFSFNGERDMYFFKGRFFWKFHPQNEPHIDSIYPRFITTVWKGLAESIDAGFIYRDRNLYIFKGNHYYRVGKTSWKVELDEPPYPRLNSKYWFNCGVTSVDDKTNASEQNENILLP